MRANLKWATGFWFKSAVAVGFLLALTTVVIAVLTYRFVAGHLALDHLNREAGRYAALIEHRAQRRTRKAWSTGRKGSSE